MLLLLLLLLLMLQSSTWREDDLYGGWGHTELDRLLGWTLLATQ